MAKYVHLATGCEVPTPSGSYCLRKEVRLALDGQDLFYVLSHACVDASCCGATDFDTAIVPGFIVRWKQETNERGLPVSEVVPVTDETTRARISSLIKETEHISRVEFW
ncbi:MAG: hypothetical protein N2506_00745 [Dehalococcoidales bacterium]|nr:hypothetical protein [Dehalococcoidales bacterium]